MLAAAIAAGASGQLLLRAAARVTGLAAQLTDARTIAGLSLYCGAALLYVVALRKIPVSVAFPCTAASYLVVVLAGHFAFGEALGAYRLAALGLIMAGVSLLALAR